MALPTTGQISFQDIENEFGGSHPIGINEYFAAASGIPGSGNAISVSDFRGKSSAIPVSVSFNQCYDHYATVYYDGNGNVRIQSREPSGGIHTGRGDCSGGDQGDYTRYSFNKSGKTTINITISASGRNGSGSTTINQSVNSTFGPTQVGATDGDGGASIYSFTITGTIS